MMSFEQYLTKLQEETSSSDVATVDQRFPGVVRRKRNQIKRGGSPEEDEIKTIKSQER